MPHHEEINDLTLEKMRIQDRIHALEMKIQEYILSNKATCGVCQKTNETIQELLVRHDKLLMGTNENPGIATRVDRLEQTEKGKITNFSLLWATISAVIAKLLYDLFTHKNLNN